MENKTEQSDSEGETCEYCAYGKVASYIVKITTAGGGLMNGNAYQYIELHYKDKEEWETSENFSKAYLIEVGKEGFRKKLMDEGYIHWSDTNTDCFNLVECDE